MHVYSLKNAQTRASHTPSDSAQAAALHRRARRVIVIEIGKWRPHHASAIETETEIGTEIGKMSRAHHAHRDQRRKRKRRRAARAAARQRPMVLQWIPQQTLTQYAVEASLGSPFVSRNVVCCRPPNRGFGLTPTTRSRTCDSISILIFFDCERDDFVIVSVVILRVFS